MGMFTKLANGAMLVVFVSWALFQYNDPDPLLWMVFYGMAALACLLFLLERLPVGAAIGLGALGLLGVVYLGVQFVVQQEPLSIMQSEILREGLGALCVAVWMGFLALNVRRQSQAL